MGGRVCAWLGEPRAVGGLGCSSLCAVTPAALGMQRPCPAPPPPAPPVQCQVLWPGHKRCRAGRRGAGLAPRRLPPGPADPLGGGPPRCARPHGAAPGGGGRRGPPAGRARPSASARPSWRGSAVPAGTRRRCGSGGSDAGCMPGGAATCTASPGRYSSSRGEPACPGAGCRRGGSRLRQQRLLACCAAPPGPAAARLGAGGAGDDSGDGCPGGCRHTGAALPHPAGACRAYSARRSAAGAALSWKEHVAPTCSVQTAQPSTTQCVLSPTLCIARTRHAPGTAVHLPVRAAPLPFLSIST